MLVESCTLQPHTHFGAERRRFSLLHRIPSQAVLSPVFTRPSFQTRRTPHLSIHLLHPFAHPYLMPFFVCFLYFKCSLNLTDKCMTSKFPSFIQRQTSISSWTTAVEDDHTPVPIYRLDTSSAMLGFFEGVPPLPACLQRGKMTRRTVCYRTGIV